MTRKVHIFKNRIDFRNYGTIMPYTFPYTFECWLVPNRTQIIALGVVIIEGSRTRVA